MWDRLAAVAAEEFSDMTEAEHALRVLIRLLVAAVLGGLLGYERQQQGKAAGIRTHMLVAMGAALFVLVPLEAAMHVADLSRVLQGVIAGIGFLCAGAIVKNKEESVIHGLTTAAGVWLTAAIGVACGLGREVTAILATLLALAVLTLVPKVFARDGVGE